MTVAAEAARAGEDLRGWSIAALEAREALVLDNLWLVARMARRHVGRGVELDALLRPAPWPCPRPSCASTPRMQATSFRQLCQRLGVALIYRNPHRPTPSILRAEQRNGRGESVRRRSGVVAPGWLHRASDVRRSDVRLRLGDDRRARPHAAHYPTAPPGRGG